MSHATSLEGWARDVVAGPNYAHIAVPRADGTVQTVIGWADAQDDGTVVLVSTEQRAWPHHLRATGTATVTMMDGGDSRAFVSVCGRLVGDTHDGAVEQLLALAKKYLGVDDFPVSDETWIKITLAPERVYAIDHRR